MKTILLALLMAAASPTDGLYTPNTPFYLRPTTAKAVVAEVMAQRELCAVGDQEACAKLAVACPKLILKDNWLIAVQHGKHHPFPSFGKVRIAKMLHECRDGKYSEQT